MKRVVIIHGYGGEPMHGFRPWLKKELEARGFAVSVPAMPSPDEPRADEWVGAIANEVGHGGKSHECILVGHSLGCVAILRYLEQAKGKIAGAVLIAGFVGGMGDDFSVLANFFEKPVEWQRVKRMCPEFVAIFSDNDPYVPLSQVRIFEMNLRAKTLVLHARGHFSSSEGTVELPEALDAVLGMVR
ncbi:MAG: alpha/beta fold hydrolase [Candidatus Micrarchaeota archaeon]|nr:alpha/beta fold hydrolase [Candidatus Micrarchaeota archaeon]